MNKLEAVRRWVGEFNAVNLSLIERVMKAEGYDSFTELTKASDVGEVGISETYGEEVEVVWIDHNEGTMTIRPTNNEEELGVVDIGDVSFNGDELLPMWGWMWTLENIDEEWVRENLYKVSECGFRVYEDNETGDIYLGIDGAGYDFYEQHWLPLYEARGLQWHDDEEEKKVV